MENSSVTGIVLSAATNVGIKGRCINGSYCVIGRNITRRSMLTVEP